MPKKTLEAIVESGNHYIVQVKGNQPKLLEQVQKNTAEANRCMDSSVSVTTKRGRTETRSVFIYNDISGISPDWTALRRLIRVERHVLSAGKETFETAYYISDIRRNKASFFARHIQNHWGIENRLHWMKDVIMKEDDSKIRKGMAPGNMSIIRNIATNIYRSNGFDSIKYATEIFANDFKELFKLISSNKRKYKIT